MKTKPTLTIITVSLAVLTGACSKPQEPAPAPEPAAAVQPAGDAAAKAADQAVQQLVADKQAAEKAAADQAAAAQAAVDKASAEKQAQAQSLIDSAKKLAAENKWAEVLRMVAQLAGQSLTPAQQTTVASLKADAEQHLKADPAKAAADAVGGLLAPKK